MTKHRGKKEKDNYLEDLLTAILFAIYGWYIDLKIFLQTKKGRFWILSMVAIALVAIVVALTIRDCHPIKPVPVVNPIPVVTPVKPIVTPVNPANSIDNLKPIILQVFYLEDGTWIIQLNSIATNIVKKGEAIVRLNIGYCYYEANQIELGRLVKVKPVWNPSLKTSRVTVGLFTKTSKGEIGSGLYVVSVEVKKEKLTFTKISREKQIQILLAIEVLKQLEKGIYSINSQLGKR